MKKIQIFIDHDIIIRHFLHNNTFCELEKHYELQYVFPLYEKRIKSTLDSLGLKSIVKIPLDPYRIAKLRHLAKIQGIYEGRKKKRYSPAKLWRKLLGPRTYFDMWVKSLPGVFSLYRDTVIKKVGTYTEMEQVIGNFSPDLILHPTVLEGVFISDLSLLSDKKKIPFVALMNSWDNPSTKAQAVRTPDYIVVWGEQTKQHAIEFLDMKPERIKILGAAQFEVYKQKPTKNRDEICKSINVNSNKKLILYAGSSKSLNEIEHLKFLDKAIEDDELKDCHVIFRPHPWRAPAKDEPDFFDITWKHISMDPTMLDFYNSPKQAQESKIHLTDYMDTHNMLSAIDLLISNMSTIMLEGALHGKPVLCMASDEDIKGNDFLYVTINSLYFRELLERLEIVRCRNFLDFPKLCKSLLEKCSSRAFQEALLEKVHFFVEQNNKDPYSVKLYRLIQEILSN